LSYRTDFFGADEALTDFDPDRTGWVATLIMTGEIPEKVTRKRSRVLERIRETFGLKECVDFQPE
jgi:pyrrolysine biosynthesis protein PylC